ncbi:mis5 protein [Corchorus olitorius]|uniref:Mis5 protein n=1 Tax=Corchorus olitorius TaxID=93759 RepID=A0A1R3KSQ4_9ROSI|nr:mis5 protein [Corchorus olitorius]
MEWFDTVRISSIDPFWPTEVKEQSFVGKYNSNYRMVPANPHFESSPMDRPIPSKPTISPRPTTSVRIGNSESWCEDDETDGSIRRRANGIG